MHHLLLASAAFTASCSAFALPFTARAATIPVSTTPLDLSHFDTPKYARPLTLDMALAGANASVTTISESDLEAAKAAVPALVIPSSTVLPRTTEELDVELESFSKRATCASPRTRTEWDSYSTADRQSYVTAIKCLMNASPSGQFSTSKSRYDDLVGLHQKLTPNVHGNAKFLLWHRYYLWTFEQLLRNECSFTANLPWFDETRYAGNFASSSIFSSAWFGSINVSGNCVTDGQFANLACVYGPGSTNTAHCLSRNNDDTKTINTGTSMVNACNSRTTYADMASCAEGGAHAWGHNGIGAVMSDVYASPSDPVFFLHHAFVDRNFRIWQNSDSSRTTTVGGTDSAGNALTLKTTVNVYGFQPDTTIGDILDTRGTKLCYKYNY